MEPSALRLAGMCGRVALFTPPERIARFLDATLAAGVTPSGQARFNLGPTMPLLGVEACDGQRVLDTFRWGLVPSWAKDPSAMTKTFNARAETVAEKPAFRSSFAKHRILVPIDGFYEWKREGSAKQPWYFHRSDGQPLVLAGIAASWHDPNAGTDAPVLRSCTVITTDAEGTDLEPIHHRVPVVLEERDFEAWLAGDDLGEAEHLLAAPPAGTLLGHEVGRRVGNVRNDGPELIEAVAPETLF